MADHNPYQAPQSNLEHSADGLQLAGRGERLGAAMLDGILMLSILFPAMYAGGYFAAAMAAAERNEQVPFLLTLAWSAVGFAVFVAVQGWPLSRTGQTWGKKLLGIRIVTLEGAKPALTPLLLRRFLPVQVINLVPVLGGLANLVNVLLIFRADRRCGHDLIAGTRVVRGG
jgi:uncharacterized RDD family membrane protein YckC